jgi:hypothetical protein
MPELNQMSVASLKSALGTMASSPQETVQILKANFPNMGVRQDASGNFILRSSVNQQEYAIPPGISMGDIPRFLGSLFAFTPAGRAATIPGAIAGSAATQAAIEATQAATGGQISPEEVAIAGALGPTGQIIQRGTAALRPRPAPVVAPRVEPTFEPPAPAAAIPPTAPSAPVQGPAGAPMGAALAEPIVPAGAAVTPEGDVASVLNLARKAGGFGPGSSAAKAKLIDMAQVNPEAKAAADRLGIEVPFDVFSDNPQVRSAVGLTRALVAGEPEAAWESTVRQAIQRADEISQQFDANFIEGRPAPGMTSQKILDNLNSTRDALKTDAKAIYDRIDEVVPKNAPVNLNNLRTYIDDLRVNLGESGRMTPQEANLAKMLEKGELTYFGLKREKDLVGQAVGGLKSPYDNMAAADLKRLYAALAQDQMDNVAALAGDEARRELRAANLMTTKQKALEKRIVGAFGQEIDGSVAQRMQSAITTAAKGDAAAFNRLMKVVPEELRKETIATALASVTAGKAAGRAATAETVFSPTEYTKVYRGLRSNPPVYARMVSIMGPEWDRASRDLYEVSRRIADAQARIPTTGKANQILGDAAVTGLMGKVMSAPFVQRAATGLAGLVPGGGLIAPDIVQFMSNAKGAAVQKASKLFTSPEFQDLAVQAATQAGNPSQAAVRRVAISQSFRDFANAARLPQSLDARIQWLQSGIQAGRTQQENQ